MATTVWKGHLHVWADSMPVRMTTAAAVSESVQPTPPRVPFAAQATLVLSCCNLQRGAVGKL